MMRWGSKKKASSSFSSSSSSSFSFSSSTHIHTVSRLFSIPWLLKFKRASNSSDSESGKEQQNGKLKSGSEKFQSFGSRETGSIGKQGLDGLKTLNKKRSVVRENTEDLPDVKNGVVIKTPRLPVKNDQKWKKSTAAIQKRSLAKSPGTGKKTISMILEEKRSSNRNGTRKENGVSETPRGNSAFSRVELEGQEKKLEGQEYKEKKMKEVKAKSEEHHRKSLYISSEIKGGRPKQKQRFKSVSPRASPKAEFCRLKALNNMKRAKLKIKTHEERQTGLGSHPVVKYSPDPQKDFKDSMVEMIVQKRIWLPEELEKLLACYLTLNSAEYHDMIVNAFQQVWLDLNKSHLGY